MSQKNIFRVVDNAGNPVGFKGKNRNGRGYRAKGFYKDEAVALGVATQYNNMTRYDSKRMIDVAIAGAPFTVQGGVVQWEDVP